MADLALRDYAEADRDAVAAVWLASWNAIEIEGKEALSLAGLRERLSSASWLIVVAEAGGSIAGFVAVERDEGRLRQLFVSPPFGRGLGTALLAEAKRLKPDGFWLRTQAANRRARRFYARSGLRLLGEHADPASGERVARYAWP